MNWARIASYTKLSFGLMTAQEHCQTRNLSFSIVYYCVILEEPSSFPFVLPGYVAIFQWNYNGFDDTMVAAPIKKPASKFNCRLLIPVGLKSILHLQRFV